MKLAARPVQLLVSWLLLLTLAACGGSQTSSQGFQQDAGQGTQLDGRVRDTGRLGSDAPVLSPGNDATLNPGMLEHQPLEPDPRRHEREHAVAGLHGQAHHVRLGARGHRELEPEPLSLGTISGAGSFTPTRDRRRGRRPVTATYGALTATTTLTVTVSISSNLQT